MCGLLPVLCKLAASAEREFAGVVVNSLQFEGKAGQRTRMPDGALQAPGEPTVIHLGKSAAQQIKNQVSLKGAERSVECGKSREGINQHAYLGIRPGAQGPQSAHTRNRTQPLRDRDAGFGARQIGARAMVRTLVAQSSALRLLRRSSTGIALLLHDLHFRSFAPMRPLHKSFTNKLESSILGRHISIR